MLQIRVFFFVNREVSNILTWQTHTLVLLVLALWLAYIV